MIDVDGRIRPDRMRDDVFRSDEKPRSNPKHRLERDGGGGETFKNVRRNRTLTSGTCRLKILDAMAEIVEEKKNDVWTSRPSAPGK